MAERDPIQNVVFFCACILILMFLLTVALSAMALRVDEIEKGIILRQADEWGLTVRTRSIYDDLADYFNLKK